jgi:hypothetical protein
VHDAKVCDVDAKACAMQIQRSLWCVVQLFRYKVKMQRSENVLGCAKLCDGNSWKLYHQ